MYRVMIVDDEMLVAAQLENLLKEMGHEVMGVATSGQEALEMAQNLLPDLILMDIVIPCEINGIELAKKIRSQMDVSMIFIIETSNEKYIDKATSLGAYGYIVKPFQENQVRAMVEIMFYNWEIEYRLQQTEGHVSALYNFLEDFLFICDEQLHLLDYNPFAVKYLGYTKDDLAQMSITDLHPAEFAQDVTALFACAKVGNTRFAQIPLVMKNGMRISVETKIAKVRWKNKVAWFCMCHELGQKKMEEQLLRARKLESIGLLAGGIAHDYNNLLTGIIGNISLAQSLNSEDSVSRLLEKAQLASVKARELTQRLITFAKGGSPIKKTADVVKILQDSVEFALSGSNVESDFAFSHDLKYIEADQNQIREVIHNVIVNAKEAMPDGGLVKIEAKNIEIEKETPLLKAGTYVRITVTDQGSGIPAQNREKIFDPYFTTKEIGVQRGMGLGLAICHSIIKKHDGTLTANSPQGKGATFCIHLPASKKKVLDPARDTGRLQGVLGSILVMDDEEMVRSVAGQMLDFLGYKVEYAKNGTEALEIYQKRLEQERPFNAVILDLTVRGGLGGKEAIGKLLKIDPKAKAIVSSGYFDDPVMTEYLRYGFKGALSKPYSLKELKETIGRP